MINLLKSFAVLIFLFFLVSCEQPNRFSYSIDTVRYSCRIYDDIDLDIQVGVPHVYRIEVIKKDMGINHEETAANYKLAEADISLSDVSMGTVIFNSSYNRITFTPTQTGIVSIIIKTPDGKIDEKYKVVVAN
ncbi:MAG: hypothetical protein LBT79_04265 [Elusimicrobiota bacterium]|jgi:hypothetical protein|nr:hypothetical protein [Elusimicrobiota bacterium]